MYRLLGDKYSTAAYKNEKIVQPNTSKARFKIDELVTFKDLIQLFEQNEHQADAPHFTEISN